MNKRAWRHNSSSMEPVLTTLPPWGGALSSRGAVSKGHSLQSRWASIEVNQQAPIRDTFQRLIFLEHVCHRGRERYSAAVVVSVQVVLSRAGGHQLRSRMNQHARGHGGFVLLKGTNAKRMRNLVPYGPIIIDPYIPFERAKLRLNILCPFKRSFARSNEM